MMKFHENIWYGTLRECIDELYDLIDFEYYEMPIVNYAASAPEKAKSAFEAYNESSGWFGFKDIGNDFDCDTISLLFAHYGGGGIESLELTGYDPEAEKKLLMEKIRNSTECCGYSLRPDEYTVFELDN